MAVEVIAHPYFEHSLQYHECHIKWSGWVGKVGELMIPARQMATAALTIPQAKQT